MSVDLFGPDGGCGTYTSIDGIVRNPIFSSKVNVLNFDLDAGAKEMLRFYVQRPPEILDEGAKIRAYLQRDDWREKSLESD